MRGAPAGGVASPSGEAAARDVPPLYRLPLLVLGFIALILGIGAGLARLGWAVPAPASGLIALHGPLMVSGFLGTVIGLERAVALRRRWAYGGPLLTGLGALAFVLGAPPAAGALAMVLGSAVLLAGSLLIVSRQRELFTLTMALGAASWLGGNVAWGTGTFAPEVVALWVNFLVLTIAGERLELSRFLPPSPIARRVFAAIVLALLAGAVMVSTPAGARVYGAGWLALALWLVRQDIARRTVRERGLTRFIAVCLLSGYFWLALGGLILLGAGGLTGLAYDAALHAVLLGFVFSMIFGHAPVIFPSVVRVRMPYHWSFYVPLLVLHASLIVRLAGDGLVSPVLRSLGGLVNAAAVLVFILSTAASVVRGTRAAR